MSAADRTIRLSPRLESIARLVTPGHRVADIGTDHAYLPIWLCQMQIAPAAIAADLRKGPLEAAAANIRRCGLTARITVRQSDGLAAFQEGEAETLILAGMGGKLSCAILERGGALLSSFRELLLQPQSEIVAVRRFLAEHGFRIADEVCTTDEGKFYPVIRAVPVSDQTKPDGGRPADSTNDNTGNPEKQIGMQGGDRTGHGFDSAVSYTEAELAYGPCLLKKRDPLLRTWLLEKKRTTERLCTNLRERGGPSAGRRLEELNREEQLLQAALDYYEM